MRKVYVTIKSETMVKIIAETTAILLVDDGKEITPIVKWLIERGGVPDSVTIEDIGTEVLTVQGFGKDEVPNTEPAEQLYNQVIDFITGDFDDKVTKYISHEITDSK